MGRGPKSVRVHLLADLVVVRLQGVLTAAEQHLALALPGDKGRDLLKSVRTHLIETSRTRLEAMVEQASGIGCLSMHHDVSTVTGEEVFLFTLVATPKLRPQNAERRTQTASVITRARSTLGNYFECVARRSASVKELSETTSSLRRPRGGTFSRKQTEDVATGELD